MSINTLRHGRQGEHGQAVVFVVITLVTLIVFVAAAVNVGRDLSYKMELQNTADSAAMAGAVWEARGLNLIAGLNQGIVLCVELIVIIVSAIALLTVCAGTLWWAGVGEACTGVLPLVLNYANEAIPRLWNTAKEMSKLEAQIAKIFPVIVPVAVAAASGANPGSPLALTYPWKPSMEAEPPLTSYEISLNVTKGGFKDLIKAVMTDVAKKIDAVFPLLSRVLSVLGESIDMNALSSTGAVRTNARDSHSYDNYSLAVEANRKAHEPAPEINGVTGTKKVEATWFYKTTVYNEPDPCNHCERSIRKQSRCGPMTWSGEKEPPEVIPSGFMNCSPDACASVGTGKSVSVPLQEKTFCKLDITVVTTTESESPSELPCPMKLHPRAGEFLSIAVAVTDLGNKRPPVFIGNRALLPEERNPWGFIAVSQARPESASTKPGDILLEMDWDAHLTRFTALNAISEQLGMKSTNNVIRWLNDRLILH